MSVKGPYTNFVELQRNNTDHMSGPEETAYLWFPLCNLLKRLRPIALLTWFVLRGELWETTDGFVNRSGLIKSMCEESLSDRHWKGNREAGGMKQGGCFSRSPGEEVPRVRAMWGRVGQ